MSVKDVQQPIVPTHILGTTGTGAVADIGFRALSNFKDDLGLGTLASQNANNVNITGGTISGVAGISGVTDVTALSPLASSGGTSPQISLTGTVPVNRGGTGQSGSPSNGQLLIGTGTGYSKANLTAGSNITITNSSGGITISSTASGGGSDAVISAAGDTGIVTTTHTRAVIASTNSRSGPSLGSIAVIASDNCTSSIGPSAIVASSNNCSNLSSNGFLAACTSSENNSIQGALLSSTACETLFATSRTTVIASSRVRNSISNSIALGWSSSGNAATANRKIHLFGQDGDISIFGSLTQGVNFTDFAEMMPNSTGAEILPGTLLTLENGAVRPADEGEEICGVVSHTAAILAGDTPFCWQGRYLHDEFGKRVYETIPDPDWVPGGEQTEADRPMITVQKENPEWDSELPQVPRSERPDEWTPVGMIGQVYVRTGEQVHPGDRIGAKDGLGYKFTERTGVKVMSVTKDFDGVYGIARCLVNIMA